MMELNKIYCQDCFETMDVLSGIDCILTSPPYNTDRPNGKLDDHSARYESFNDWLSDEEYTDWTLRLFEGFDRILKKDGCVLYNISYSVRKPWLMWNLMSDIQRKTGFVIADCIVWKKPSALPNNTNYNKLTRVCEFVFVLCRKDEIDTFKCYKGVSSTRASGQQMYQNHNNFIEAPNNDGNCPIHKATFSSALVRKLLILYTKAGDVVYDPFMGTGTTAIGCIRENRSYIGSELSKKYVDWAENRIKQETSQLTLF